MMRSLQIAQLVEMRADLLLSKLPVQGQEATHDFMCSDIKYNNKQEFRTHQQQLKDSSVGWNQYRSCPVKVARSRPRSNMQFVFRFKISHNKQEFRTYQEQLTDSSVGRRQYTTCPVKCQVASSRPRLSVVRFEVSYNKQEFRTYNLQFTDSSVSWTQ